MAASAIAIALFPDLHTPPEQLVERVVTVALLCILFDGGMHLGWSRFRRSAAPITVIGVAGTFLTAAAAAVLAHVAFGLDWYLAALLGTAVSPTDPAVVFSVLGRREVSGRSGDILEGSHVKLAGVGSCPIAVVMIGIRGSRSRNACPRPILSAGSRRRGSRRRSSASGPGAAGSRS